MGAAVVIPEAPAVGGAVIGMGRAEGLVGEMLGLEEPITSGAEVGATL